MPQYPEIICDGLPAHMQEAVVAYLLHGQEPVGFLQAILENNLVAAFSRADAINRDALPQWASWLYSQCPAAAWGSPEKVRAWIARRRENLIPPKETPSCDK